MENVDNSCRSSDLQEPLLASSSVTADTDEESRSQHDGRSQNDGKAGRSPQRRRNPALLPLGGLFILLSLLCFKGHFPNPFKRMKHGRVQYMMEDVDGVRLYHRDMTAPCDFGILFFRVAPASKIMSYTFEVYQDEFYYKEAFCPLLPTRTISTVSNISYIATDDPTLILARFNYLTRISSLVIDPPNAKTPKENAVADYCGDYVVVARGPFYDADVYRQLMDIVHNWTDDSAMMIPDDSQFELDLSKGLLL